MLNTVLDRILPPNNSFFLSLIVNGQAYSSESWEKNKRYSEQAAAIVALHCLGIRTIQLDKGASTGSGIVYISDNLNVKNQ